MWSLGEESVGWILLFQPGSILHHYINTQCAVTSRMSGQGLSHTITRSTLDLQDRIYIVQCTYISRPGSISTFNNFPPSRLLGLLHTAPVSASGILTRIWWWWAQPYPGSNLKLHNWEIRIIINLSILSIFNPMCLLEYTPGAWKGQSWIYYIHDTMEWYLIIQILKGSYPRLVIKITFKSHSLSLLIIISSHVLNFATVSN